jgi:Leucine-rich repeat (LRR) protein
MSDTDSDPDSISDASNAHIDAGDDDSSISSGARELCNRLLANDPGVFGDCVIVPFDHDGEYSDAENISVLQALKEYTSAKRIEFTLFQGNYTERYVLAAAECVESSKTLKTLQLGYWDYCQDIPMIISALLRALSRNTSVTELITFNQSVRWAGVAFRELLTRTQTLQKLEISGPGDEAFEEVQRAAITSGFANNKSLRDLKFVDWRAADLAPVLIALQNHPRLQKIHLKYRPDYTDNIPSLSGLEVLLRSQDSKVKELVLEKVDTHAVGLYAVLRELGCNTTVTNLTIRDSVLGRDYVQQLKAVVRRNTALQHLVLRGNRLRSEGLAEIAPVLYRNPSIKSLDLSHNGLDDIESANLLRELIRRNKTITSLCFAGSPFGSNSAAARIILEGVRSNTALQQLDLGECDQGDHGILILANALAIRNTSILELDLHCNEITSVGVRALVNDNVEVVKTLTKLRLSSNPIRCEGATILADALGRNAMPSLKQLQLDSCGIRDDGFVALVSALEQNTSLQILNLAGNSFGEQGFMALAESLPSIKGLQQIGFTLNVGLLTTLPLMLEGFRKNTSLVKVDINAGWGRWDFIQEIKVLGHRNRFNSLLKTSDLPDTSPHQLGIWSLALAKVATEPDVLFHVLRNKPKLVESAGDSKKRKRNDE